MSMPILLILVIGGLLALFVSFAAVIVAVHRIKEGNVGIYYKVLSRELPQHKEISIIFLLKIL
jgi:hypothetical protein